MRSTPSRYGATPWRSLGCQPFSLLAREQGWRVLQFSHAGCPPIIGVHRTDRTDLECNASTLPSQDSRGNPSRKARRRVSDRAVESVLSRPYQERCTGRAHLHHRRTGEASAETAKKSFARHMPETINQLSEFSRVVVFKDTPVLKVPVEVGSRLGPTPSNPAPASRHASRPASIR